MLIGAENAVKRRAVDWIEATNFDRDQKPAAIFYTTGHDRLVDC
jgi:hypothetical protein